MKLKNVIKGLTDLRAAFTILSSRGMLNWMADEQYIRLSYRIKHGGKLNLDNPSTFNEKLQWLKLNDRRSIYSELVDKFAVRRHIAGTLGEECLIPLVGGPWCSFSEIDFSKLPERFVLKCTHDSGGLYVCREKSKLNVDKVREIIERSLRRNYYWLGREWPYKNVPPRIIAEAYMEDENKPSGLTDYKFFCFSGKAQFVYISQGLENHDTAKISFFDLEGKRMPFHRRDYKPIEEDISLPGNFEEMIFMADKLAKMVNNSFVRIDLYSIQGKVYFSEITFSPCSGLIPFEPSEWDEKLGHLIDIPTSGKRG